MSENAQSQPEQKTTTDNSLDALEAVIHRLRLGLDATLQNAQGNSVSEEITASAPRQDTPSSMLDAVVTHRQRIGAAIANIEEIHGVVGDLDKYLHETRREIGI